MTDKPTAAPAAPVPAAGHPDASTARAGHPGGTDGPAGSHPGPEPAPGGPPAVAADSVAADSGAACLVLMLRVFGLPGDASQLQREYGQTGQPMSAEDIVRAGKRLGLKARIVRSSWQKLVKTPMPLIAEGKSGRFVIIGKIADATAGDAETPAHDGKALVQDPGSQAPMVLDRAELEAAWSGRLVMLAKRAEVIGAAARFGIAWFIPAVLKYKKLFSEVLVASFFLQIFALITPLFFQVVIDKVLVHRGLTTLDVLAIGLVAITLFETLLGTLRTYVFSHTTNRIDVELGAKLFRHLLSLPMGYFQSRRVGESVARVRELETIRDFLTGSALTLVIDLLFTVVFFVVMYMFSPTLTWIVLGSIPLYVILSIIVTPILRKRLDEKFQRGAINQAFLVESVTGVETLKAMAVEPQMQRKWEEQIAAYVSASFRAAHLGNVASQVAQFISKVTTAALLYVGAHLVISGDLTIGQLVAFNMLAGRVAQPVLRLAQLWQDFQQARIALDRLGDILNTAPEPTYNPQRGSLPAIKGRVSLEKVTFRYRPDTPEVLRRIDLDVPPGQIVGIVGPSGSGKSTLTKLVQRMYVPESGRVLIDGVDLSMVDTAWLRQQVGVVLQENVLFNRSVRDNIALTDPGMAMERVVRCAQLAGAHDFILELPEAYDTLIGERGGNLSGGQRQRMAIARALATDPRILIFDEATSALDYESERIIQQNMQAICAGRTVLIIAHRLAAVRIAHRIITVERGEIVEDGTHEDLLRAGGRYSRLWAMQSGDMAAE